MRAIARRTAADLLRLPWRNGYLATARNTVARCPARLLHHRAAAPVPRTAARQRADERNDQRAHGWRPAKGRRYRFEIAAARAGLRQPRSRPHGKGARARATAPLQFLPSIELCRATERPKACRPTRGLSAQGAARL